MEFQIILCVIFSIFVHQLESQLLRTAKDGHEIQSLTDDQVKYIADLSNTTHLREVLDELLVPRVVGTPNHLKVFNYIKGELANLNWNVEIDEFVDETPVFGKLTFKNIIAKLNPNANRFLTLACHYDSKYFAEFDFIGATDSAVPCAMLLNTIKVLNKELDNIKDHKELSLQLIFFDGEEAFHEWGPTDSIYGAKHLADKLHTSLRKTHEGETVTHLDSIDVLVLLDLIGAAHPKFYNFFENTKKWYDRLPHAEGRLSKLNLLTSYEANNQYFMETTATRFVEDDHIPFIQRDVPILHLITLPFPEVWHTKGDDGSIVHLDTVENLNKIMRVFLAEYLHLFVKP